MHMKQLPEGLLTALGSRFLKEFYTALNADPQIFIIVERSSMNCWICYGLEQASGVRRYFKKIFF